MNLSNLRKNIIAEDEWTPEDIRRMYYSNRGAIYGFLLDKKKNRRFKAPKRAKNIIIYISWGAA